MPKRIVVLGAGFAGLWAARHLAKTGCEILIIDRNNYHTFYPLLYQVAAAELEPEEIVAPVRSIVRRDRNISFCMEQVLSVHLDAREVETTERVIGYDYLVAALGSVPQFFGVRGAEHHSFFLKSLEEAVALRNHILCRFEAAMQEPDAERRRRMLTFVVVGGGPTGVEFSGALSELIHGPFCKDYHALDFSQVQIVLIEATPTLIAAFPERLRAYALKRLTRMGVKVLLATPVAEITPSSVQLNSGEEIPTDTVVWTAGVRGAPLASQLGETVRTGQVRVLPTLQITNHPQVYVAGDLSFFQGANRPLPMLAPVAIQQGTWAAKNIERDLRGQPVLPFEFHDPGNLATIGRNAAVAEIFGREFMGFIAWVLWLGVHIFNLIGFRNRIVVILNWMIDYFFAERAIRLILPNERAPDSARTAAVVTPAVPKPASADGNQAQPEAVSDRH